MPNECEIAESGKHEPDFYRTAYHSYIDGDTAVFTTWCIHCAQPGSFRVHESEVTFRPVED